MKEKERDTDLDTKAWTGRPCREPNLLDQLGVLLPQRILLHGNICRPKILVEKLPQQIFLAPKKSAGVKPLQPYSPTPTHRSSDVLKRGRW